jgi:hypothetical protein
VIPQNQNKRTVTAGKAGLAYTTRNLIALITVDTEGPSCELHTRLNEWNRAALLNQQVILIDYSD